jgi:cation diffusion facilitator CzcD-associated flavoprotein CzcO
MPDRLDVAVVGAGPFGLSVAAHLQGRAVRVFGREMETWRDRMPREMLMRSAWEETSLSAPEGAGDIDRWVAVAGSRRTEPIPLGLFLRYSAWFADQFVHDRDPADVTAVEEADGGFRITTAAGGEVEASTLVLALGVMPFAYVPPPLRDFLGGPVSLASGRPDELAELGGQRVLVVGGGQAGLESAGLAAQGGAVVELVTRSEVHWFGDREPHYPRTPLRRRLYRLAYPAVGYGPPPLNRLVLHPDLFAAMPTRFRRALTSKLLRAGGSPWLRTLVEREVRVSEHATVADVQAANGALCVRLATGEEREVDRVLIACGYRFDLDRLTFLSPAIRARIRVDGGWPELDRCFRSTDPRLFFVGYAAEDRFGPISRFVLGTAFTATRVASVLA